MDAMAELNMRVLNTRVIDRLMDAAYDSGFLSGRNLDGSEAYQSALERRVAARTAAVENFALVVAAIKMVLEIADRLDLQNHPGVIEARSLLDKIGG